MPVDTETAALHKRGTKSRRSRFRKVLSRYTGYALIRVGHAIVCRLPLPLGRALARFVGTLAYYVATRERKLAIHNLTCSFGEEWSPARIRSVARRVFQNLAMTVVEWLILRRWSREKLLRTFPETHEAVERMAADVRAGGGAVGICAHLGNWEVLSLLYEMHTPDQLYPVANRLYFKKYQEFAHRLRTECGLEVIYADESPRKMMRAISSGKMVAFLPDMDLRTNSGVFVDFLGRPAYTITFPMEVARKMDKPVVACFVVRDGKGFKYYYDGPYKVPRTDDAKADILAGTREWTRRLEQLIREHVDQWSWVQPRWRTTPDKPRKQIDRRRRGV